MNAHSARPELSRVGRLVRLMRKELRETLRDRRTVITLVLMPLLVYPLLIISFNKSLLITSQQNIESGFTIGVQTQEDSDLLEQLLMDGERQLVARRQGPRPTEPETQSGNWGDEPVALQWFGSQPLASQVANLDVHAAVIIHRRGNDSPGRFTPVRCEILFRENSPTSLRAMHFVESRLQALNQATLRARLAQLGVPAPIPAQLAFQPVDTSTGAPFSLATLVPLVLILMTITGSVYPAIDLTAGERERGTLEMLIAAPISRMALLVAKYAAVLIVAVLTAMVNLLAMTVTLLTSSLGAELFPHGLSLTLMAEIFALMILFAAFFSAIVLTLTSFARSFKEAQAYLIPVMLLAISPGLLSLMPGLRLSGMLAVAPLVNIVLLSRDILEGTVQPAMAALAVLSTAVYAVAAIALAARVFGNDALLYASRGSWSDLLQRPETPQQAATPAGTLACLATLFPCYFVLANLAQRVAVGVPTQLQINALVTIAAFGVWPILFAVAQRVELASGFQFRRAPWWSPLAALALGLTLWPLAHELFVFGQWLGLVSVGQNHLELARKVLDAFRGIPAVTLIFFLAIVPAVMEELFFRGYLFQGLRRRFPGPRIIVVTAVIFGLFHVLSPTALMPERFLPSTLLGLVLGWLCYRSGSVLPGMLLHACHNGLLLLMVQNQQQLMQWGWDQTSATHVPTTWLIAALLIVVGTIVTIQLATKRQPAKTEPSQTVT